MKIFFNYSLKACNTFNIKSVTAKIYFPENLEQLLQITIQDSESFYVLGEGSNTLFCQQQAPIIIKPNFMGIEINDDTEHVRVSVACAQNWHEFVEFCLDNGIYGLENLALIPGSVGAAPVQNIGAYGVEVGDFIEHVSWFDFKSQKMVNYNHKQCQFSYRNSIFKQVLNGQGVITHVHFKFPKIWQPVLSYQGLNDLPRPISAQDIMLNVIKLRQAKLPDPNQLPNAGSFFKNPIINEQYFSTLQQQYPNMPYYLQSNGDVKLAAGWLIEQTGLKGFRQGSVGVHEKQALVLVNYGNASGQDVVNLAQHIQQEVAAKFAIELIPEVRFIGCDSLMGIQNTIQGMNSEGH